MGLPPQQLAQYLTENNQIPALVAEVLRSKALNLIVEHVKISDESGNELDLDALRKEINGESVDLEAETVEQAEEITEAAAEQAPAEEKTEA